MPRKTVDVAWMVERTNKFLSESEDSMVGERKGMSALLEAVLFETGNYRGFQYLATEFVPGGNGLLRDTYDDTRRRYY